MQRSPAAVAVSTLVCLMSAGVDNAYLRTLQASGVCTSGIDITQAPYAADPTGTSDSSSAFNAAITAAGAAGTSATALYSARSARDSARRAPVTISEKLHHDHLYRPDNLLAGRYLQGDGRH